MTYGPDPNAVYPNPAIKSVCFIKNIITRANIVVGDYTYYDNPDGPEDFESHVTHHYEFLGDRLVIGKFCAIARGIEFVMNGANHRMRSVTTYPFNIMGGGWEKHTPMIADLPFKGDTVVGNDVWIGKSVTIMPGVHIGDGAIIAANAVVTNDIPAYHIAGGNPCRIIRKRFDDDLIEYLLELKWWDWHAEKIFDNLDKLCSGDLEQIKTVKTDITSKESFMRILDLLDSLNTRYWVDGGWGVDVLIGRQTREHRDVDIDFDASSEGVLLDALEDAGYRITTDWRPSRVELYHKDHGYIDVHPLQISESGDAKQAMPDGAGSPCDGWYAFQAEWFSSSIFEGRTIPCISAQAQRLFRSGYELREVDKLDLAHLDALEEGD